MKNQQDEHPLYKVNSHWKVRRDSLGDAFIRGKHGTIRLASKGTLVVLMDERHPRIFSRLLNAGGRQVDFDADSRKVFFPVDQLDEVAEILEVREKQPASPLVRSHLTRIREERIRKLKDKKGE